MFLAKQIGIENSNNVARTKKRGISHLPSKVSKANVQLMFLTGLLLISTAVL